MVFIKADVNFCACLRMIWTLKLLVLLSMLKEPVFKLFLRFFQIRFFYFHMVFLLPHIWKRVLAVEFLDACTFTKLKTAFSLNVLPATALRGFSLLTFLGFIPPHMRYDTILL